MNVDAALSLKNMLYVLLKIRKYALQSYDDISGVYRSFKGRGHSNCRN